MCVTELSEDKILVANLDNESAHCIHISCFQHSSVIIGKANGVTTDADLLDQDLAPFKILSVEYSFSDSQ